MKPAILATSLVLVLSAGPVLAESHTMGDAVAGEKVFNQCQSCHVVRDGDDNVLAGRNAKTGPNLFGLPGRQAGTEEFRYGADIVKAGEDGLVWGEEEFVSYVMDPTKYLRDVLSDPKARGKMAFKLRDETDAQNVWAFIASLSPEVTN